jgi:hypothetical protein
MAPVGCDAVAGRQPATSNHPEARCLILILYVQRSGAVLSMSW